MTTRQGDVEITNSKYDRRDFLKMIALAMPIVQLADSAVFGKGSPGDDVNSIDRILGKGAKVSISPNTVTCESSYTFKIQITLGQGGLSSDDSIGLVCGSYIDRWNFGYPSHFWGQHQPWQTNDAHYSNFTTAVCDRPGTKSVSMALRAN